MKFRSCDCARMDDRVANAVIMGAPEGTFAWGTQEQRDGSVVRVCRVVIPYVSRHSGTPLHVRSSLHVLRVHKEGEPEPSNEPSWLWDGNEDYPTLTPSIGCGPKNEKDWHGYMTAGRLKACE